MKVAVAVPSMSALVESRVADYLQLVRPRLALLVLVTVGAGWLLATAGEADLLPLVHASIGTALLFAGASALNQLLERHQDALMARTANRPLPAGRLQPVEVLVLGSILCGSGLVYLLALCQPLAAGLGALALLSYVFVYTPLKVRTPLNTLIGAVPGAVPPLIGCAAARGSLDRAALSLFLIVFLWQVPHFLAIAWIYRGQYARAGFRVLPVLDPQGVQTGKQMIRYTLALIPASLMPCVLGAGGWFSGIGALMLGAVFLYRALVFARTGATHDARLVFRMSLVFLPALLLLLALDVVGNASGDQRRVGDSKSWICAPLASPNGSGYSGGTAASAAATGCRPPGRPISNIP
jgi:protoheme IX farnesyltransferase